jgi:PhzF family phenazine biosynthesis protein
VPLPLFQVDAFADEPLGGNPAAVMPLGHWLPDQALAALAAENNLAETAFLVPEGDRWAIRWFTPKVEVELCGHATLAAAWVVFHRLAPERRTVTFRSPAGPLEVTRDEAGLLAMTLPRRAPRPLPPPPDLLAALRGAPLLECWRATDLLAVLGSEAEVRALDPDLAAVARLDAPGLIVTAPGAPGGGADFVSRCFYPNDGIPEDPVTGSAHCTLAPYWAGRLGRRELTALQASRRGGRLGCQDRPEDGVVRLTGRAALYLEGTAYVPSRFR